MRPLFADRSCQQTTSKRFVSTWPHIWSKSVEIFFNCHNASAPLCACSPPRPSCPPRPILILLFSVIVLAIATIIDAVFELESRDFCDFNAGFNVFNNEINNECELENSGPSWPQTLTHPTAPPNDTLFNFNSIGAGLHEFNDIGCIFAGNMDGIVIEYDISICMYILIFFFVFLFVFVLYQFTR